jgi:hypothetical protein
MGDRSTLPRNISQQVTLDVGSLAPQRTSRFYFAAAAAAGDLCVLDLATTVDSDGKTIGLGSAAKTSPAGTDDAPMVVGVTPTAILAEGWADIVNYGVVRVKGNANLDAGDPVCGDTAVAGQVREYVEGTDGNRVGFALEADGAITAGFARIFVQLGG